MCSCVCAAAVVVVVDIIRSWSPAAVLCRVASDASHRLLCCASSTVRRVCVILHVLNEDGFSDDSWWISRGERRKVSMAMRGLMIMTKCNSDRSTDLTCRACR